MPSDADKPKDVESSPPEGITEPLASPSKKKKVKPVASAKDATPMFDMEDDVPEKKNDPSKVEVSIRRLTPEEIEIYQNSKTQ
jgi:hypothetical protein